MTSIVWKLAGASLVALALVACNKKEAAAPRAPATPVQAPAAPAGPDYGLLLSAADRPAADAAKDANRKPAQVLAFSKIMPGQSVFEMEAGAGYYTELLSHAVGPNGHVIMQAPPEFEGFYKKDTDVRLKDNRLANVKGSASHFDKLDAADGSVDVVTWFQGPHELWFKPKDAPKGYGDPAKSFAEAFRVLKPGGYFVVMDHIAAAGSPAEISGDKLHRIDPAIIKKMAETAGFKLDQESNMLANPADDHTKIVFDKSIQGSTDQILLRYKKPT